MASNKTGFIYYSVETDRYQDIRIKRLKKECGCIGLAVYDYLLCEIYRVKGCFLEWDESTVFDVSEYLGLKENTVKEIVSYCCSVGLFNKELLSSGNVLTSAAIQSRFIDWSKKAKRSNIVIPEKINILPEETDILPEERPKLQEESAQSKVKKSKVKDDDVITSSPPVASDPATPIYGTAVLRDIEVLKAECLADQVNFIEHICRQNKVKSGIIPDALEDFNGHLRSLHEFAKSTKDYRQHFQYWFKKQDLAKYKPTENNNCSTGDNDVLNCIGL